MWCSQGALLASLQEQVAALEAKSQEMLGLSADAKAKAKEEKLAAQLAREVATKERSEASQARILAEKEQAEAEEAEVAAAREEAEAKEAKEAATAALAQAKQKRIDAVREQEEARVAKAAALKEMAEAEEAFAAASAKKKVLAAAREKAEAEQREADEAAAAAARERAEAEEAKAKAAKERAEAEAAKEEWRLAAARKYAMHWLAVTQASMEKKLKAKNAVLRSDGRPVDQRSRERRDRLAQTAREHRPKPPLFSPFGGTPGARACYPERVAFQRLGKLHRSADRSLLPTLGSAVPTAAQQLALPSADWHTPPWALSPQNIFGCMAPPRSAPGSARESLRSREGRRLVVEHAALCEPQSPHGREARRLLRGEREVATPRLAGGWLDSGEFFAAAPRPPPSLRVDPRGSVRLSVRRRPPAGRHSEARAADHMYEGQDGAETAREAVGGAGKFLRRQVSVGRPVARRSAGRGKV